VPTLKKSGKILQIPHTPTAQFVIKDRENVTYV
jgi:hypothetical protein